MIPALCDDTGLKYVRCRQKEPQNLKMTRDRIQSLNELGFEWEVQAYTWEKQHQQLAVYKDKFGRTNVPAVYKENKPLETSVKTQRAHSTSCSNQIKRVP